MNVLFVGIPVRELSAAVEWYSRFFGRRPDIVPDEHEVMWRVTDGGWLYVIEDSERAGNGLVAISLGDLDESIADVAARGISAEPVDRVGDAGRKAMVIDPDGNRIALIQVTP